MEKTPHWRDIRPQYLNTSTTREARQQSMIRFIQHKGARINSVKNEELTIVCELIIKSRVRIEGEYYKTIN